VQEKIQVAKQENRVQEREITLAMLKSLELKVLANISSLRIS